MATYEEALRMCLLDAKGLLENRGNGHFRHEHAGQERAVIRDIRLLWNREDCPSYDYKKGIRKAVSEFTPGIEDNGGGFD